ncbi:MAG: hypothetical protein C0507_05860 [Cyanobacteria bacterium PR.3.49]|jgi:hypothetical protein|nr:hypothetical protein [Cyanobacteria bacterium PR.3.49]
MSEQQAEAIVARFQEAGQSRNFSAAVAEITAAQRQNPNFWREHGERVNAAVDFNALGFNTDFQVLGVNNRGQLITSDDGGATQQRRAGTRLGVVGQDTAPATGELWGNNGRRFQTDAEGRQTFTVRRGDYLDRIARDVASNNLGRTPTEQDVVRARQAIAAENRITNPNNIPIGTTLRIPEALATRANNPATPPRPGAEVPPPAPPAPPRPGDVRPAEPARPGQPTPADRRGLSVDQTRIPAEGAIYNPLSPPGTGADAGFFRHPDTYTEHSPTGSTVRREGGREITEYRRQIGMWPVSNVDTRVREEVNPQTGILQRRTVNYEGDGATFAVRNASGGYESLRNVTQADVYRDPASGQYTTTYTLRDGTQYRSHVTAEGRQYTFDRIRR